MSALGDPQAWGRDRLHLTPQAHDRVALRVLEELGEPVTHDWRAPLPTAEAPSWRLRQQEDLRWMREFVMPYVRRRLRGHRTGEGFAAKRPELLPLDGGLRSRPEPAVRAQRTSGAPARRRTLQQDVSAPSTYAP